MLKGVFPKVEPAAESAEVEAVGRMTVTLLELADTVQVVVFTLTAGPLTYV